MTTVTIGMSDAKANFSRLTADANKTGQPITVFKNNKPWVEIRPLASSVPTDTLEAMIEAEVALANPQAKRFSSEQLFREWGI